MGTTEILLLNASRVVITEGDDRAHILDHNRALIRALERKEKVEEVEEVREEAENAESEGLIRAADPDQEEIDAEINRIKLCFVCLYFSIFCM